MTEAQENSKKFLDWLGMGSAIVTVIAYLLLVINAQWPFLNDIVWLYNILQVIHNYAPLIVVAIVGLEFVSKKSSLIRILYYAAVALIIISMFFPSTWDQFVGLIEKEESVRMLLPF